MQKQTSDTQPLMNKICIMGMLRRADIKLTKQRVSLASILFNFKSGHFTAEDLHDETKIKNLKISLATVYNTLNHFSQNGLIKTLQLDNQKTYYDRNTENHYHVVNEKEIEDISTDAVKINIDNYEVPEGKIIKSIDLVITLSDK